MDEHRSTTEQDPPEAGTTVWFDHLDGAAALIVLLDRGGRILRVNSTFARTVGCAPADLEGCELWELVEAEQVNAVRRLFDPEHRDPGPRVLPLRWLSTDNHRPQVVWSFAPVANGVGQSATTVGVGLELSTSDLAPTRPQDAPQVLAQRTAPAPGAEARPTPVEPPERPGADASGIDHDILRLIPPLLQYSSHTVCVLEPDGTLIYVSPSVERLLGVRAEELTGTNAFELVHSEDIEKLAPAIRRGFEQPNTAQQVECRLRHTDGSWRVVDARGIAHNEPGRPLVVVNIVDISDHKRAEEALAQSEERFRSAFENTAIGKVVWSPDGRVVRANRAVRDILGYQEEEMLALSWGDHVHPDDKPAVVEGVRALLGANIPSSQLEVRVRHRDGPWIWGRATLSAVRDAAGKPQHVIGELEDVTAQRRAEDERRARQQRIERQRAAILAVATDRSVAAGDREAAFRAITEAAAQALGVARVGVWLLNDDRSELVCADQFDGTQSSHSEGAARSCAACPRYLHALECGAVVEADDAPSDPRTSELADDHLRTHDVVSALDAPIRIGGEVVGAVCHEQVGTPRIWQADEITFVGEVANQVANAMASAQRKRAERRLQASEERFRSIVTCSPMGLQMYRVESDGRLVFTGANPAADKILGVDCQRYIGKTLEEAFPPLAATEIPERYRQVARDGVPWHVEQIEYRDELVNGAYELHAFRTAPDTVTVMFAEITDRKRADAAMRDSEERYRLLFERNLAAVYRATLDGRILECNDAFAAIVGCRSRAEALSRPAADFYSTETDRTKLLKLLRASGELRNHEIVLRRTDGDPVWVLANISLMNDSKGEPTIMQGTMIDVTQRKKAADRLVLQSTALEAAANAIVISDPRGTIEWVNQAFTRLTGYSASEAIGESLWILKSGREQGAAYEEPWRAVAAGRVWRGELVNRRKDGRLYTEEVTITPVRGAGGDVSHLVAVQQDISDRKRMEEQLLQAQKMEAVGRLAGGVAHDFNNLLQAMLGVTELLRQPELASDDAADKLQELEELVQRGSQLTRQLLLFSRRDTPRREELDLNEVVQGTVKLLHRLLRENIVLEFETLASEMALLADRGQIEQVVMNLAVNACDAMPHGGRLRIATGSDAGSVWLEVADTGEGIPEEIRSQLFEPFFTTKERGKGTGLGLSVVHGIVTRLGGRIDLDSTVGSGTTIRVTFPAVAVTGQLSRRVPSQGGSITGAGERVLVVEDDPAVRDSLEELLGVLGYRVTAVGSRGEAVGLPEGSDFTLLLSDYVLPDGSGTDIARQLRSRWPGLGVIVMSGYAQDESVGMEAARGNLHFLQKPFSAQALTEVVRSVIAETAARSDGAAVD